MPGESQSPPFIKHERPDIYEKAFKFLEPMDCLTSRLTGRVTATQKTMAPFMIADNRKWDHGKYNDALLQITGLDRDKLPEMIPNNGVVGPLAPDIAEALGYCRPPGWSPALAIRTLL